MIDDQSPNPFGRLTRKISRCSREEPKRNPAMDYGNLKANDQNFGRKIIFGSWDVEEH